MDNLIPKKSQRRGFSFTGVLNLAGEFFMEKGAIHETMRRLARSLNAEGIDYVIVGGMALAAHGYARLTLDVDVLVTAEGLNRFKERLVGRGYIPAFQGANKSFRDAETKIPVEFITTGEFPGDGLPKPVAFPHPSGNQIEQDQIRFVSLDKLIELKLASGASAPHRLRDLSDVQDLILALDLPLDFQEKLDNSVQTEYRRLWEAAQSGRGESRSE
jgi:hypothetical protein